jgi:hypothetical protein
MEGLTLQQRAGLVGELAQAFFCSMTLFAARFATRGNIFPCGKRASEKVFKITSVNYS